MKIEFDIQKTAGDFKLCAKGSFEDGLTGVWGPSGSGKTTLLHCLAGFQRPDVGEINIDGEVYFSSKDRICVPVSRRDMGIVFQDGVLFPHMSAQQNLLYAKKPETPKKYIREVMDLLELNRIKKRKPHELSGGERQRVALGRTLIHKPAVILMDEPVSSIDLKTRYQIILYIKRLHHYLKIPIVYVSHSISELLYLVEKVLVLHDGKNKDYGDTLPVLTRHISRRESAMDDIENIYELLIESVDADRGMLTLDFGGFPLKVPRRLSHIQPKLKIGINAHDVIVSTEKLTGISAQNVIPAVIESVDIVGDSRILHVRVNSLRCLVELTQNAFDQLKLKEKQNIYLIVKARSISVLE